MNHGELLQKIFERRLDLKWKSRHSLQRRRLSKQQSFLEKVAICNMMCQWLLEGKEFGKGILFQDFDYKNNTYLFDCESLVLFDVPRSSQPDNLRLIENLKNGYLVSSKYEVLRKVFSSSVVVVF